MGEARLIVICGLPGSGKTTLAKRLESRWEAVRFCPDEWMFALSLDVYDEVRRGQIEALQWTLAQEFLRSGRVVLIEWGTWGRWERDILRCGARSLGAAVELRVLEAPMEVLMERLERRKMEDPPLTRKAMERNAELFERPAAEELAMFDPPLADEWLG